MLSTQHPRNKYDELKALADKGGVVGIYLMPYLGGAPNQPSKELVMQHIDHALKVCGEDHVGIGTDGGIEKVELTPEQEKAFKDDVAHRKAAGVSAPEEDRYPYVPDFNGPRKFELIATELQKRLEPDRQNPELVITSSGVCVLKLAGPSARLAPEAKCQGTTRLAYISNRLLSVLMALITDRSNVTFITPMAEHHISSENTPGGDKVKNPV